MVRLVPVMFPSEGLVCKPFPAPGFAGSFCGGYRPVGPNPVLGSYGMPPPQYQQAAGMPPGVHFDGQSYFPPYGMPMISPSMLGSTMVQSNPFSGSNPVNPTGQSEGASRCSESPEDAPPRGKRARVVKAVPQHVFSNLYKRKDKRTSGVALSWFYFLAAIFWTIAL